MVGEKGQPPICPRRAAEPSRGPCATTDNLIKAIQTIKAFIYSTDWPKRARDIWKYIKTIAFSKADQDISNVLKDIQELKA